MYGVTPEAAVEALKLVRDAGLGITLHAGDADGAERVLEAAELGATRIGHGVRLADTLTLRGIAGLAVDLTRQHARFLRAAGLDGGQSALCSKAGPGAEIEAMPECEVAAANSGHSRSLMAAARPPARRRIDTPALAPAKSTPMTQAKLAQTADLIRPDPARN